MKTVPNAVHATMGAVKHPITMERTANSNRIPPTLPFSGVTLSYIGGSSSANKQLPELQFSCGAQNRNTTRAQLQTCLTNTALLYPSRNSTTGDEKTGNAGSAVNYAVANYQIKKPTCIMPADHFPSGIFV
ncbi:MAG: hypothetical protein IPL22_21505 [Bacteroidetes bacterium]|nr:hypothetical protein [Bacteroidota bacterium]